MWRQVWACCRSFFGDGSFWLNDDVWRAESMSARRPKVFRESVRAHKHFWLASPRAMHANGVWANLVAIVRLHYVRAHVFRQTVGGQVAANLLDRIVDRAPGQCLFDP